MLFVFTKTVKTILVNGLLLVALIISIQNSNHKSKVNLYFIETIELPISFIVGVTFISGSFIGSFFPFNLIRKKN
tara:strand:- start:245 stop:469 length:225 start_codon:yes stop_codon:yes gene_type:complete